MRTLRFRAALQCKVVETVDFADHYARDVAASASSGDTVLLIG